MARRPLTREELRRKLERLLRRLAKKEQRWRIPAAADMLVIMLAKAPTAARGLPSMHLVGRGRTQDDIEAVLHAAERGDLKGAQRALDALHGPAIDAFATPHITLSKSTDLRPDEPPFPPWAKATRTRAGRVFGFQKVEGGRIFESLRVKNRTAAERVSGLMRQRLTADVLPEVAAAAKRALRNLRDISVKPATQLSAEDHYFKVLMTTLGKTYRNLTGMEPEANTWSDAYGQERGPFLTLVESVFKTAGIKRNPTWAAKSICRPQNSRLINS
jgi:hypothetical protein